MIIRLHRKFEKQFARLPNKLRDQFKKRRDIFLANPYDPILNNHLLHEPYAGCRSINITGDYRAIYFHENPNMVRFIAVGTHHEIFGT